MLETLFDYLNRHLHVSHEVCDRLSLYHDLLLKWQSRINLVGPGTLDDVWKRHFLDSLQLYPLIPDPHNILVDIGSGAGFPGMVLAIAGVRNIHLVESDSKKIAFLREVAWATETSVSIHHQRAETLNLLKADIITARACASLDTLLKLSFSILSCETTCLFPKGKNYSKEIEDAQKNWQFNYTIIKSVTDPEAVILRLTDIQEREHDQQRKPRKP